MTEPDGKEHTVKAMSPALSVASLWIEIANLKQWRVQKEHYNNTIQIQIII